LLWAFCGILGMITSFGFMLLNKVHHSSVPIAEVAATD